MGARLALRHREILSYIATGGRVIDEPYQIDSFYDCIDAGLAKITYLRRSDSGQSIVTPILTNAGQLAIACPECSDK